MSLAAGAVLVLAGVFLVLFGTYRYRWVARELPRASSSPRP